jgi:hypothetical protein
MQSNTWGLRMTLLEFCAPAYDGGNNEWGALCASLAPLLHPGMTALGRHGYNVGLPRLFTELLWQPA